MTVIVEMTVIPVLKTSAPDSMRNLSKEDAIAESGKKKGEMLNTLQ